VANRAIGVYPISRLHSRRTATDVLRVTDHDRLTVAVHCRGVSGMALRVKGGVAHHRSSTPGVENRFSDDAPHLNNILIALVTFVDNGTAGYVFCKSEYILVVGMTEAYLDGSPYVLLISGHVGCLTVE
jgi:hypothetical protein